MIVAPPRIAPHDAELERAALGAGLYSAEAARTLASVGDELFYLDKHRAVQQAFAELASSLNGTPPDLALVKATTERAGHPVDESVLALIFEAGIAVVDVSKHVSMLRALAAAREECAVAEMIRLADQRDGLRDARLWRAVTERLTRASELRAASQGRERAPAEVTEVRDLLAKDLGEEAGIIGGGIIPRQSLSVAAGNPKVGKSLLIGNAAIKRSLGWPWLGFETAVGRTLWFNAELPEREMQARSRLMLAPLAAPLPDGRLFLLNDRGIKLDTPEGLARGRRFIEKVEPDWLLVDPAARFFTGDENSARDTGRLIAALDLLIQQYGLAVTLVHHFAKPSADAPRKGGQRLRGSSALFAAADSVLLLDRAGEGGFQLSFELRSAKEPEPILLARTPSLWLEPAGPPEDLLAVSKIVDLIPLRFGKLAAAVESDLEVSKRTAERLIGEARKALLIVKDEDGAYRSSVKHRQVRRDGEGSSRE